MSIKYEPSKLLKKLKLKKRAKDLVTSDLNLNRATLRALTAFDILPKKVLETVALEVISGYRKKAKKEVKAGASKKKAAETAVNDGRNLVSQVQGVALRVQTRKIQKAYRGAKYRWLPSIAREPRAEHIKNYGKIFILGKGDKDGNDPGDLPNCQCGMEILTDDTQNEFNEKLEAMV